VIWGGDGYEDIPNGQTWDGWATGREWEATGTGLDLWTGGVEFHVYVSNGYNLVTGWPAWTEITGDARRVRSFTTRRAVRNWWQGAASGGATLEMDYTGGEEPIGSPPSQRTTFDFGIDQKVRITVDVPSGEKTLFTGFCINSRKRWASEEFPIITVQLLDVIGWSGQKAVPVKAGTTTVTGNAIRTLISGYQPGYEAADIANLSAGVGLTVSDAYSAGNLVDTLNQYIRGEPGLLWAHADGTWRYKMRGWWYPLPNPVATIGSTDRGGSSPRNDPSLTAGTYEFPATSSEFSSEVTYTSFTWTGVGVGPTTSTATAGGVGARQWNDTNYLTVANDLLYGVRILSTVLDHVPTTVFRYGEFDDSATITINTDTSIDSLDYCAVADIGDFVEVAKETQPHIDGRWWVPGHVMGVTHSYSPQMGWVTVLDLDLGLAHADYEPDED
jgi:hypothetical protein